MRKKRIIQHLGNDLTFRPLLEKYDIVLPEMNEVYPYLGKCIIYQQLSTKSADSIYNKFLQLFRNRFPSPVRLLRSNLEELRTAGVSRQKATYLLNIADYFKRTGKKIDWERMSNDDILEHLTSIKGVGTWTAQMVLMFALCREDIFPSGDLGIQQSMESLYGISYDHRRELLASMEEIAQVWSPYRSIACLYLWQHIDNA